MTQAIPSDVRVTLTDQGRTALTAYNAYLARLRDDIVAGGLDEVGTTQLPTEDDVVSDIRWTGWDEDGDYLDCWAVTDGYDSDVPLALRYGEDFVCA